MIGHVARNTSAAAVDVWRASVRGSRLRHVSAHCDRDATALSESKQVKGVAGCLSRVDIAAHCANADDLSVRVGEEICESEGVVDACVAVEVNGKSHFQNHPPI